MALLTAIPVLAQVELPPGGPIDLDTIKVFVKETVRTLSYIASVAMVVFIILAGLKWLTAGANSTKQEEAKKMFRTAIIGSLIILGVGVIIWTIQAILTGSFFGFIGNQSGQNLPVQSSGKKIGEFCGGSSECASPLICKTICQRSGGNLPGEPCQFGSNCAPGLSCGAGDRCYRP